MEKREMTKNEIIADGIFKTVLSGKKSHPYPGFGVEFEFGRFCDQIPLDEKHGGHFSMEIYTPFFEQYEKWDESNWLSRSRKGHGRLVVRFSRPEAGRTMVGHIENYRSRTENQSDEKSEDLYQLLRVIESELVDAEYFAAGKKLEPSCKTAEACLFEALDFIVPKVFPKFTMLETIHENPAKEIRTLLKGKKRKNGQLFMDFDMEEPEDMKEINTWLGERFQSEIPTFLSGLVAHFSSPPHGWPALEICLILAKLLENQSLYLAVNATRVYPNEAVNCLIKPNNWDQIQIVSEKPMGKKAPDSVVIKAEAVFGTVPAHTVDTLATFIRDNLAGWQKLIKKLEEKGGTERFPGKELMISARMALKKLMVIENANDFLNRFDRQAELLQSLSEKLRSINQFFPRCLEIWESMCATLEYLKPNRPFLENDPEIWKALEELDRVFSSPDPFQLSDRVESLLEQVRIANESLVIQHRKKAMDEINDLIFKSLEILNQNDASAEERNETLYPLNRAKKIIKTEFFIPELERLVRKSREHLDDLL